MCSDEIEPVTTLNGTTSTQMGMGTMETVYQSFQHEGEPQSSRECFRIKGI